MNKRRTGCSRAVLIAVLWIVAAWSIPAHVFAAFFYTPPFELDTRNADGAYSALFTLDTRDTQEGTVSRLFTLDTRGDMRPYTPVFTLDTRGVDTRHAPTNVHLHPQELTVLLVSWAYQGTPRGFAMERRPPLGEWVATILEGGEIRSWHDRTVMPGEFYEYRVAAILEPAVWSDYSETAYIQTPSIPRAPESLAVEWVEPDGGVLLSWHDTSHNEAGFDIWRKTGLDGIWASRVQVSSNTTAYVDVDVEPATFYAYKIRAFNRWGNSAFSGEAVLTTPGSPHGCGFQLLIEDARLDLDGLPADPFDLNEAHAHALVEGTFAVHLRNPPGQPHPVRVVLGFRDMQGRAAGSPVEVLEFYSVPGCPGRSYTARVPPGFRVPEEGAYTLWLEMILARRDPVAAFIRERHTQEAPMRKRLLEVDAVAPDPNVIRVRALDTRAIPGVPAEVPIYVSATPGLFRLEWSIEVDDGVAVIGVEAGPDAPQAHLQVTEHAIGNVGLTVTMPLANPLGGGSMHIANLQMVAEETGDYAIRFTDSPLVRSVAGGPADGASLQWEDGTLRVSASNLAGDIYPRPYGDGVVDEQDVRLAFLFAIGLLDPPSAESEFRRLDVAPLEECGDGVIDLADYVAIQSIAAGDVPPAEVCEPTTAPAGGSGAPNLQSEREASPRAVYLDAPLTVVRGQSVWIPLFLDAQGNEHALTVSLTFDPDVLAYRDLDLPAPFEDAECLPNLEQLGEGVLSIGVRLPDRQTVAEGLREVLHLQFQVLEGAGSLMTPMSFSDWPAPSRLVDPDSVALDAVFVGAYLQVLEATSIMAPFAPENTRAESLSMSQIRLSWSPASWPTGYRIRRRLDGDIGWSILAELGQGRTAYLDSGLAPGTQAEYLITALTPQGDESSAVRLSARTWTRLEHWRHDWFGQIENEGWAADAADPDGDAIPNRLEFELGLNPLVPNDPAFVLRREEIFVGWRNMTLTYSAAEGAPGRIQFEATPDLLNGGSWRPISLVPVMRSRTPDGEEIKLRLPDRDAAPPALFLRMRTE